jgi:tetratricopeptide (TPR) repeat protein
MKLPSSLRNGISQPVQTRVCSFKEDYSEAINWAKEDINQSSAPTDKADAYLMKAFYEYWRGEFQEALDDAETARMENEGTQNLLVPFYAYVLKGFVCRSQQNYELSRESFIQAEKVRTKRNPFSAPVFESNRDYFLGSIDIEEGNIEAARKRLATIKELLSETENAGQKKLIELQGQYLLGELLIAEGSFDEAISILEQIPSDEKIVRGSGHHNMWSDMPMQWDLYQPWIILARAYTKKGETDKAIGLLEKSTILDPPSNLWLLIPPKIYYDLGRLYEKKGMKEKTRENYTKFLDLWKNADPGLPEVEDAKAKLAALKN